MVEQEKRARAFHPIHRRIVMTRLSDNNKMKTEEKTEKIMETKEPKLNALIISKNLLGKRKPYEAPSIETTLVTTQSILGASNSRLLNDKTPMVYEYEYDGEEEQTFEL